MNFPLVPPTKAKKKPVKKMKPEDLKIDLSPRLETLNVSAPPARQGGAKVRLPLLLVTVSS